MTPDELKQYAQEQGERFWKDAGQHWLNDGFDINYRSGVIEIGGYLGDWTDYVQRKYGCFVDVYEPVEEYFQHMKKRFSNRPEIKVINAAVEDTDGECRIAVMGEGSSMYNGGVTSGPLVPVVDASRVVREMLGTQLLAINAEGSEYVILDNLCYTGEIEKVKQLLVQFHTIYPFAEEKRASIRERLVRTHYEKWAYPFCWEMWVRK